MYITKLYCSYFLFKKIVKITAENLWIYLLKNKKVLHLNQNNIFLL